MKQFINVSYFTKYAEEKLPYDEVNMFIIYIKATTDFNCHSKK